LHCKKKKEKKRNGKKIEKISREKK